MRLFKQKSEPTENKDSKKDNRLTILSYKTAYERLIRHIHNKYWRLELVELEILDKSLADDEEISASRVDFFLPKKDGAVGDGSGPSGEKRLREFLRGIYIIQSYTLPDEGCLPLLKCIEGVITSKQGHHFPGLLSEAVRYGHLLSVRFAPQPHGSTVNLTEDLAKQGQELLEKLQVRAETRCGEYSSPSDSNNFEPVSLGYL